MTSCCVRHFIFTFKLILCLGFFFVCVFLCKRGIPWVLIAFLKVSFQPAAVRGSCTLRKHAYSNILKISPPKNENFQIKNSDIFHISAQNIDCGYSLEPPRGGGSKEYPHSMFLSRNKKIMSTPLNPSFTI